MKNIEVSDEIFAKIKDQFAEEFKEVKIESYEDLLGKKLFIRTVTYHTIGRVERIVGDFLVLSTASWIPDSGRFMNTIKNGHLDEVEPTGTAYINMKSIVDFFPWYHDLPTDQK